MKLYTIKMDGKYIAGESEEFYSDKEVSAFLTNKGFHFSNKCGISKLKLSRNPDEALIICGIRNLHSWIDKLHTRVDSGLISFKKMTIEEVGER